MEGEALVGTLVATLVGGILSVLGSVYVAGRENRRRAWIRLFDEMLPELRTDMPVVMVYGPSNRDIGFYANDPSSQVLSSMKRTARLAGRKTARLVSELEAALVRLYRDPDEDEERRVFMIGEDGTEDIRMESAWPVPNPVVSEASARLQANRRVDFERVCSARADLEQHLRRKLRIRAE